MDRLKPLMDHFLWLSLVYLLFPLNLWSQGNSPDSLSWKAITPTRQQASLAGQWLQLKNKGKFKSLVAVPGINRTTAKMTFSREFYLPSSLKNQAFRLSLLGINYACTILVNNVFVAGHTGGYTSFDVILKPTVLKFGEKNSIQIEIDGRLNALNTLPAKHRPLGWPHNTGILRDLYLEALPAISIDDVSLKTQFAEAFREATLSLGVTVRRLRKVADSLSAHENFTLFVEARDVARPSSIAGQTRRLPFILRESSRQEEGLLLQISNPKLWSPANPNLYYLKFYLTSNDHLVDQVEYKVGLRKVAISGKQFYLNDKPFAIQGVDWIENLDGLTGDSLNQAIEKTIQQIKLLGANTVRPVGHAPHPQFVEKCSEAGLFVLEDLPAYYANSRQLGSTQILNLAAKTLEEMIQRDKRQPSLLAWGLGVNLQDSSPEAEKFIQYLVARTRELDQRPTYLVSRSQKAAAAWKIPDFILLDLFEKDLQKFVLKDLPAKPVLPVIGYFVRQNHAGKLFLNPERRRIEAEELQAERLQQALNYFKDSWPSFPGYFAHTLFDYQSEYPLLVTGTGKDMFLNSAGLIRQDGQHKISFRMVAAYNLGDRKPPISPDRGQPNPSVVFTIVGVAAIFIFLFFLNRDKRLRGHLRRVFVHPHGFYMDLHENRKIPVFLTFLLGILEGVTWACIFAGALYAFRQNLIFDEILSLIIPSAELKEMVVWLVWHPLWLISALTAIYLLEMIALAIIFRFLALFFGKRLPLMQFITFIFWTGTCYLLLAFIAPIFYRLVVYPEVLQIGAIIALVFGLWHLLRIYRGIRVLYFITAVRAALIIVLLIAVLFGTVGWYYQHQQALLDYIAYYRSML